MADSLLADAPGSLSGVARVLVNAGKLDARAAETLTRTAKEQKRSFVSTLVQSGVIEPGELAHTLRGTALALLAAASLSACAPLLVGTAVGGAFVAADRRTSGALLEDQSIELKAANRIRDTIGNQAHVNVTSYNRHVLLTGEVQDDHARESAARAASQVENVVNVMNELVVAPNSSLSARSNDVLIQGKVKATLIDARDLMANAFKVVVERGEVYLMGVVTEREANRAAELTATISGVRKVVKAFQVISEDELARRLPSPATNPNTGSNAGSAQPQ